MDYVLLPEGEAFIVHGMDKKTETLMAEAKYLLYTCKRGKPLKVMSLPLIIANIFLHSLQPHHAVTLDKAADHQCPPHQHYTKFG